MDTHIVLSVLAEMRQFRRRDHWTRTLLEAHQADALHNLRDYAYMHSPFYQRFHSVDGRWYRRRVACVYC